MSLTTELVNLLDERVVRLRDGDKIFELSFELRVALAEHRDLALDERYGGAAGACGSLSSNSSSGVTLEEVGMALEVVGDRALRKVVTVSRGAPLFCWLIARFVPRTPRSSAQFATGPTRVHASSP